MTKKRIKTSKEAIASYWNPVIESEKLVVNSRTTTTHCWRCGIKKRLDRCHIVAESLGGTDEPSNFVLLCKHCHIDSPDVDDPAIIWEWLRAYAPHSKYPFWLEQGTREYEYIYGVSLRCDIESLGLDETEFFKEFESFKSRGTHHFGQPRYNKATVAGILRLTVESIKMKKSD